MSLQRNIWSCINKQFHLCDWVYLLRNSLTHLAILNNYTCRAHCALYSDINVVCVSSLLYSAQNTVHKKWCYGFPNLVLSWNSTVNIDHIYWLLFRLFCTHFPMMFFSPKGELIIFKIEKKKTWWWTTSCIPSNLMIHRVGKYQLDQHKGMYYIPWQHVQVKQMF